MAEDINIYAFAQVDDAEKQAIFAEIKKGKSRFGWSFNGEINNLLKNLHEPENRKQKFLTWIKEGDWIVHVNCPKWGECVAVQAIGTYQFDEGPDIPLGKHFRHYIPIDPSRIIQFNRREATKAFSSINLAPRSRYHIVYAKEDFLKLIDILQRGGKPQESNPLYEKTNQYLKEISKLLAQYHRSKKLESFLAEVFRRVPGVSNVKNNGSGWGTDHGADLVVHYSYLGKLAAAVASPIKMVVQVKAYQGTHSDPSAIEQTLEGMETYDADIGLIVTTAEDAEPLTKALNERKDPRCENIAIIAGEDVARLVIDVAPDLIFDAAKSSGSDS